MVRKLRRKTGRGPRNYSSDEYGGFDHYMKLTSESDGFDTTPVGGLLCGGIKEYSKLKRHSWESAVESAKLAVAHYNRTKKKDLVFDCLVKVNGQVVSGFMFYHTIRAHSKSDKRPKIYQVKVWKKITGPPEVQIFRERPKNYKTPESGWVPEAREMMGKPLAIRKKAFLKFRNDVKKLPELTNMRYSYVTNLASKKWRSMSPEEKAVYSHSRRLKYEDIEAFMSDLSE